MANIWRYRRGGQASVASLLEYMPRDGCLLIFNAKHRVWRSDAADTGCLTVAKVSRNIIKRNDRKATCDLRISWKEDVL